MAGALNERRHSAAAVHRYFPAARRRVFHRFPFAGSRAERATHCASGDDLHFPCVTAALGEF